MNLVLRAWRSPVGTPRGTLAVLAATLAVAVASCGGEDGAAAGEGLQIVATTAFAAEMTRAVAGDAAQVEQLVPTTAGPHSYSASARDRATLDQADLVVAFGRNYEEGLPLEDLDNAPFEIAEHAGDALAEEAEHAGEEDQHAGEHGHEHDGRDPHVWTDPTRLAAAAPALADALAMADPAGAQAYRERARTYAGRLRALDAELDRTLAAVPEGQRKLVTSHESLGYFAERYGFEMVAAPFGLAPEAQASADDLAAVVAAVRAEDVPVVFAQEGDDSEVMRRIAQDAGVEVVDDLLVENPAGRDGTYADAMRHNARRIAEALAS